MRLNTGVLLIFFMMTSACMFFEPPSKYIGVPTYPYTPLSTAAANNPGLNPNHLSQPAICTLPPITASWHIQYTGELNTSPDVKVYNIDLFDADLKTINRLREHGIFVMCYFSAGSYEDWPPDASLFHKPILG
jgi:hypothetical protein